MSEIPLTRRRLTGASDLSWITFIFFTALVVTTLLLGHLRAGFELYRMGNDLAYASNETRVLENEQRSLQLELQHRAESVDVWGAAEALGFEPAGDDQVVHLTEAP